VAGGDYGRTLCDLAPGRRTEPMRWVPVVAAWTDAYRSMVGISLPEFDDGATFLYEQARGENGW
jgi:hypothetical protein